MTEEAEPGNRAQDAGQRRRKLRAEAARGGGGLTGKVRALLHNADRELAGEYERREDPDAPANPDATQPPPQSRPSAPM